MSASISRRDRIRYNWRCCAAHATRTIAELAKLIWSIPGLLRALFLP